MAVVAGSSGWVASLPVLLVTLAASILTNVYIVGINQLTDIDIDRINKPFLPLAAGTMSVPTGKVVVAATGLAALVLAAISGPYLLAAIAIGLAVGTAYSLPPLRLKRFHVGAAMAITSVRALVVNLLIFAHLTAVLYGSASIPRYIWALTGMVLGLTIAIAWFKDIPDAVGDARHGIATLVLRLGVQRVMAVGLAILAACYVSLIVAGVIGLDGVNGVALAAGHLVLLAGLGVITVQVDVGNVLTLTTFYRNIWRLFFAEYIVFTAAVLLS